LLEYTVFLIHIERKFYSGREYLKNEANPASSEGDQRIFQGFVVAERCICKIHLGLQARGLHGKTWALQVGGEILALVKPVGFLPVILIRARISP